MTTYSVSVSWDDLIVSFPNARISQLQRLGVTANGGGLDCDGRIGPITRGASYLNPALFFAARDLHALHADLDPNARAQLCREKLGHFIHPIAVAAFQDAWSEKGETIANNKGPYISELYEDPNPEAQQGPWCGVAGRRWIRAAYPTALPNKRHAYMAKGLAGRMRKLGAPRLVQSGDQVTFDRFVKGTYDNLNGHASTCVAVDGDLVWCIEGNVDVSKARDGMPSLDGVAVRRYMISAGFKTPRGTPLYQVSRWVEKK